MRSMRTVLCADAKSLRQRPLPTCRLDFAMPDGVIYPVGSSN